jgi:UDP-N-acetylmuramate--alanine ligase
VEVFDDYGHHPAELSAALDALRRDDGRLLVLFQPHLFSRTRHLARAFAVALARADAVAVAAVYPAREEPIHGVDGKLVVDALAEVRPGMTIAWTPDPADGAAFLTSLARAGDRIVTIGAGDVDRTVPSILDALR